MVPAQNFRLAKKPMLLLLIAALSSCGFIESDPSASSVEAKFSQAAVHATAADTSATATATEATAAADTSKSSAVALTVASVLGDLTDSVANALSITSGSSSSAATTPSSSTTTSSTKAATDTKSVVLPPPGDAQTDVDVQCSSGVSGVQTAATGFPLPYGTSSDATNVVLVDANGAEVAADITELARWRHLTDASRHNKFIRSLFVVFKHNCSAGPAKYALRFNVKRTKAANAGITPSNVATTWGPMEGPTAGQGKFTDNYAIDDRGARILEPKVWASPNRDWLIKSAVRTLVAVPGADRLAQIVNFSKSSVNDVHEDVVAYNDDGAGLIDWRTNYEAWLFDRNYAHFNTYTMTGDLAWRKHFHRSSAFYAAYISSGKGADSAYSAGALMKKPLADDTGDPKYSHAGGLYAYYLMTGDASVIQKIRDINTFTSSNFNTRLPAVTVDHGLWTERIFAVVLENAIYSYETTGEDIYANQIRTIMQGMITDTKTPPAGYPAGMNGVLYHSALLHEGASRPDMIMSPWMAALLMEQVWKYYLMSGDKEALVIMSNYGQEVAIRGLYTDAFGERILGYAAPWYWLGMTQGYTDSGIFVDHNHAYDVLGLIKRGRWARQQLGGDTKQMDFAISSLTPMADWSFTNATRDSAGLPRFRLSPTRKFGWWFGATADMYWFDSQR